MLAARLAEQQEAVAASAVVAERARIAREVHDSVAHSVSVMVLQMGGLRRLLPDHPEAQEVLLGLERLGREAVDEMRRVVGILREGAGGEAVAEPAPQPSLSRLDAVLDELRTGGMPVELHGQRRAGRAAPAGRRLRRPGGAGGAVQRRPARRGRGHDRSTWPTRPDAGHRHGHRRRPARVAAGPPTGDGPGGHGQLHMRERVAVAGGTLEVGPVRGGGYRVRAVFPVAAASTGR